MCQGRCNRREVLQCMLGLGAAGVAPLPMAADAAAGVSELPPVKTLVLLPLSGPASIFAASSRNCTELAVSHINARGGIAQRPLTIQYLDAGRAPEAVAADVRVAYGSGFDAVLGMHDSAVREAVVGALQARVPYIYTPVYEGGACSRGLYVLGETPQQLLRPSIPWINKNRGAKRWYLIGNDYAWPRKTNEHAERYIAASGASIVGESYHGFDVSDFSRDLARIEEAKADAVLITLVGVASVSFNRQFGERALHKQALRLGPLIEENTLALIGAPGSVDLYAVAGYFANIPTTAARQFRTDYLSRFGRDAPVLNTLAQSCYEGLRLLQVLGNKAGRLDVSAIESIAQWAISEGPRGMVVLSNRHAIRDVYLARAEGGSFNVVKVFEAIGAEQPNCRVSLIS